MLKVVQRSKFWLIRHNATTFATSTTATFQNTHQKAKKPYEVLLTSSIDLIPKLPNPNMLRTLTPRFITNILVSNHALKHQGVLQAHIECLYTLISRAEPSIEGIAIFVDYIHKFMLEFLKTKDKVSFDLLMKPTLMMKFAKIAFTIDSFYNEYLRMLMSSFIIQTIRHSTSNMEKEKEELAELWALKEAVLKGQKKIVLNEDQEQIILTPKKMKKYFRSQEQKIKKTYLSLQSKDLLSGIEYVLKNGYYSDFLIKVVVEELVNQIDVTPKDLSLLITQLKIIVALHKYKKHQIVSEKAYSIFNTLYSNRINQYFQLLQNNNTQTQMRYRLFLALHDEQKYIQEGLLTEFLTKEDRARAKTIYMKIFKNMLNCTQNGSLMLDVPKIRGIYEVVIIMFTHQDTKQVYELLELTERAMILYPIPRLLNLETQCAIAEKYGFKSDIFANHYYDRLITIKNKIDRNKGLAHILQEISKEIRLADKFLTYLSVSKNPSSETKAKVHDIISQLFKSNIWIAFPESQHNSEFIYNPSFAYGLYFIRAFLPNLPSNKQGCRQINSISEVTHLRNVNRSHNEIREEIFVKNNKFTLKHTQHVNWKLNQHARLATILKLANHHIKYLQHTHSNKESNAFAHEFMNNIFMSPPIYAIIKRNYNYPDVFSLVLQLYYRSERNRYPVLNRDIHAVLRLYQQGSLNAAKEPKEIYNVFYQEALQEVEINPVMIPYFENCYQIVNTTRYLSQGLIYQALRRYYIEKQNLKRQIQTFSKYQPNLPIQVQTNFLEYPNFADLKITLQGEVLILLFNFDPNNEKEFLNYKQLKQQQQSENYWTKKGYKVRYIRKEEDIVDFMENTIKKMGNRENKKSESSGNTNKNKQ